ncbi:hypothetical protein SAMN06296241_2881 [Salinimicrobium sediminis]|uniref:Uncharacterized protein n=1 Tax=Salinimicrobium sediminis TaxID=1343891 RepID=A0A285X8F6_9FLAO|nr:DUF5606 domain-containing protein [Salinimicrobium sediminis]MDX1753699.1 DUF5606 domain-containing protein [Salinimicrobium sediminis]SOC81306.1 hypothetical protein SAMN06296241_2881 [Salinimicrobium sediminis]
MKLDKVLSISGKPGLYELKAQTRGGFVAESMLDGKKISVNLRHNVSLLSEIAIYTYTEEVPLREVFQKISEKENGGEAISHKESKAKLEEYFSEVLPDYDEDRVYVSDIKKIFQWYNLLVSKGYTDFSKAEDTTVEEGTSEEETTSKKQPKDSGGEEE